MGNSDISHLLSNGDPNETQTKSRCIADAQGKTTVKRSRRKRDTSVLRTFAGSATEQINFKTDLDTKTALMTAAQRRQCSASKILVTALLNYLDDIGVAVNG